MSPGLVSNLLFRPRRIFGSLTQPRPFGALA